jgi:SSS family solute:Na+ symporter
MIVGFIVVAILSDLPNNIAGIFGGQLYSQPNWLPVIGVPWRIFFGSIVTFFIALSFRSGREPEPAGLS